MLGSILLDDTYYIQVASALEPDDFASRSTAAFSRAWANCTSRGERIDRVTLANELMKQGQLESVDGLSYLVSLDDGLPQDSESRQLRPHRQGQGDAAHA